MEKIAGKTISAPPTVAAIHDLSCFGRCALTVVMPALSAMGAQVVPIPTALLSTHTGGFENMYFKDLTESMPPIADHLESLDLKFDAIYTGFLGSAAQIDIVSDFIKRFSRENTVVLVDPVMGDDGKLYSTYTRDMQSRMYELCSLADVITPNLTEACFLSGEEYTDTSALCEKEAYDYAARLAEKLRGLGCAKTVITGIAHDGDMLGTYGTVGESGKVYTHSVPRVKRSYPGTGDLFASVFLGAILLGKEFDSALAFASDYTRTVMEYSSHIDSPVRNGVALEKFIFELSQYSRG